MGYVPERLAVRCEETDSGHGKAVRNVGSLDGLALATVDWNPHETRNAGPVNVVNPLCVRRAHRIRLKRTEGELLGRGTIRIDTPNVDALAGVIRPSEDDVLLTAGGNVEEPGIGVAKQHRRVAAVRFHARDL